MDINVGADENTEAVAITYTGANLYSGGELVEFNEADLSGKTSDGTVVYTLEQNTNGTFSFTLNQALDHGTSKNDNNWGLQNDEKGQQYGLKFEVKVTDGDGDTTVSKVNVNIQDDVPTVDVETKESDIKLTTQDTDTLGVNTDEDSASFADLFTLTQDMGADVNGTAAELNYALSTNEISGLSSNGKDIVLNVNSEGTVVTGSVGTLTIFTITLNANTGEIILNQMEAIDHALPDGGIGGTDELITLAEDAISLTAKATIVDGDDDTATDSETLDISARIRFEDSTPIAQDNANIATETGDEFITSQDEPNDGQSAEGNVITDNVADVGSNPLSITSVEFDGTSYTLPTEGTDRTIDGEYGILTINNTGKYEYNVDEDTTDSWNTDRSETDTFTYTLSDNDGDKDTADLVITVKGMDDAPVIDSISGNDQPFHTVDGLMDIDGDGAADGYSPADLLARNGSPYFSESNGNINIDMGTGTNPDGSSMSVEYFGGNAGYKNVLGFYEKDADGNIEDIKLMYVDNGDMDGKGHVFDNFTDNIQNIGTLTGLDHEVGFFIIPNGYSNGNLKVAIDDVMSDNPTTTMAIDPDTGKLTFTTGNEDLVASKVYYTDNDLSTDGRDHAIATIDPDGGITIGMEDLPESGSDQDYDDFIIRIKPCDTQNADKTIINNIGLSDIDDANLESATVTLVNYQDGDVISADSLPSGITATIVGGVVELAGSNTVSNYELALESLTFESTSDNREPREFEFIVFDGDKHSNVKEVLIDIGGCELNVGKYSDLHITDGSQVVHEAGLDDISDDSESASGTFTVKADAGVESITVGGTVISIADLEASNFPSAIDTGNEAFNGQITITGYDNGEVSYSYEITDNTLEHDRVTTTDGVEDVKDFEYDRIAIKVTDTEGHTDSGRLNIKIVDDVPTAENETVELICNEGETIIVRDVNDDSNNPEPGDHIGDLITGAGDDNVTITDDVADARTVSTGDGNDIVSIADDVKEGSLVDTGAGNDTVSVGDKITNNSSVNLGSGDDTISVHGKTEGTIEGGEGRDILVLDKAQDHYTITTNADGSLDIKGADSKKSTTVSDIEIVQFNGSYYDVATSSYELGTAIPNDTSNTQQKAVRVTGNLNDNIDFGVDGGAIASIVIDGTTHLATDGYVGVTTAEGAYFALDFATGSYKYKIFAEDSDGEVTENFIVSAVDGDGDTIQFNMTIDGQSCDVKEISATATSVAVDEDALMGTVDDANQNADGVADDAKVVIGDISIQDADNPTVTFTAGQTTDIKSDGNEIALNINGSVMTGVAGGEDIFTVTINNDDTYTFELLGSVDHPTADIEDTLDLGLQFTITDDDQTTTADFTVTIADDLPTATNVTANLETGVSTEIGANDTNLILIVDNSNSMKDNKVDTDGNGTLDTTRLEITRDSLVKLINEYDGSSNVNVKLTTFGTSASASSWMSAEEALEVVNSLDGKSGWTNYEDALATTMNNYGTAPEGNAVAYFISDGDPTVEIIDNGETEYAKGSLDNADGWLDDNHMTEWRDFIDTENVIALNVIGIGNEVNTDYLNKVADVENGSVEVIVKVIENVSELGDVLVNTVITAASTAGEISDVMGADGFGSVTSVIIDGITYSEANFTDGSLTINDGTLSLNFDTGAYNYSTVSEVDATETIVVNAVDGDGDPVAFTLNIDVTANINDNNQAPNTIDSSASLVWVGDDRVADVSFKYIATDIEDDIQSDKVTQIEIEGVPANGTLYTVGTDGALAEVVVADNVKYDDTTSFKFITDKGAEVGNVDIEYKAYDSDGKESVGTANVTIAITPELQLEFTKTGKGDDGRDTLVKNGDGVDTTVSTTHEGDEYNEIRVSFKIDGNDTSATHDFSFGGHDVTVTYNDTTNKWEVSGADDTVTGDYAYTKADTTIVSIHATFTDIKNGDLDLSAGADSVYMTGYRDPSLTEYTLDIDSNQADSETVFLDKVPNGMETITYINADGDTVTVDHVDGTDYTVQNNSEVIMTSNIEDYTWKLDDIEGTLTVDGLTATEMAVKDADYDRTETGNKDDIIEYSAGDEVDGKAGFDTLEVEGAINIDFNKIDNIEEIALGEGNQNISLSLDDVIELTDKDNDIVITGQVGDTLILEDTDDDASTASTWSGTDNGDGTVSYTSTESTSVTLTVDEQIDVTGM